MIKSLYKEQIFAITKDIVTGKFNFLLFIIKSIIFFSYSIYSGLTPCPIQLILYISDCAFIIDKLFNQYLCIWGEIPDNSSNLYIDKRNFSWIS